MSSAAFITQLIKLYDLELRRVMYRRCGCLETAADIVQETYQRMSAGNLWQQADKPPRDATPDRRQSGDRS